MKPQDEEVGLLKETLTSINQYWFGYGSATALGVFRALMASLTTVSLIMVSLDWDAWFSEQGYVPILIGQRFVGWRVPIGFGTNWTLPRIGLLNGVTDPRVGIAIFAGTVLAGILTALGLWTRVSSILFALGLVSIHHRNAASLHGGDTVMRVCSLYMAIAPSGAAVSLDRLIGIWKGKLSKKPVMISMWPQRLISYNVALLYLTTTWLKWGGGMWRDGTATYYPARLAEFHKFSVPEWFNDFPMVYITTYGTLFTEFALGTLVFFKPLRKYVLICGVLMHLHIELSMNIPLFSYLMVSTYVCFYDGEEVTAWAKRLGSRLAKCHAKLSLPRNTRLTESGAGFLEAIDPLQLVHYGPGTADTWTAERTTGGNLSVVPSIHLRSIGSWIFGWIPGIWDKILLKAIESVPTGVEAEPEPRAKKKSSR